VARGFTKSFDDTDLVVIANSHNFSGQTALFKENETNADRDGWNAQEFMAQ
jgi:hypothetical protein